MIPRAIFGSRAVHAILIEHYAASFVGSRFGAGRRAAIADRHVAYPNSASAAPRPDYGAVDDARRR